jgi:uncharacterized protein
MKITYDDAKNARNIRERNLPFSLANGFEFASAILEQDNRRAYSEVRIKAVGNIGNRLHVLIFIPTFEGIRVISLRKANAREVKRYEARTRS